MAACFYVLSSLLLLGFCRAHNECTVAEMGTLRGVMGVHTETVLPGQMDVEVVIPPVCAVRRGVKAVGCDEAGAPRVWLAADGGAARMSRSDEVGARDLAAVLAVTLYCDPVTQLA